VRQRCYEDPHSCWRWCNLCSAILVPQHLDLSQQFNDVVSSQHRIISVMHCGVVDAQHQWRVARLISNGSLSAPIGDGTFGDGAIVGESIASSGASAMGAAATSGGDSGVGDVA
jgi:hypothetical protein